MIKQLFLFLALVISLSITSCLKTEKSSSLVEEKSSVGESEIWVEMLVEIPAGTIKKLELNKENGRIEMDSVDGKPRLIEYLGYPANYGMIPNTLLALENGGDGDPLDILSIGPMVKSGELLKCKVIGVLKLVDRGEQDDKLIAISENSSLLEINTLEELQLHYPGILDILETWFENYKGKGQMVSQGFRSKSEAFTILEKARIQRD